MLRPAHEARGKSIKKAAAILVVLLSIFLIGCAQETVAPATSTPQTTPTITPTITSTATPTTPTTPPTTPAIKQWRADGVISEGEYPNQKSFGKLEVFWKTDGEFLYMAIKGQTKGWIAVGFGPSMAMKDADMIIAWVENGEVKAVDAFSTGTFGPHPPDTELGGKNDLLEVGGKEKGRVTIVEFKRKLDTGDKYDKVLTPGEAMRIIWAMADSDDFTLKHKARGSGEIVV